MSQSTTTIVFAPPAKEKVPAIERRATARCRCRKRERVVLYANRVASPAVIYDASAGGLGLISSRPIAPGTALGIRPESEENALPDLTKAIVRHCTARPDGSWVIGCELSVQLTAYQLFRLL